MVSEVLRRTDSFKIEVRPSGRPALVCNVRNARPTACRLSKADIQYLQGLNDASFDCAAVWDYGLGAFDK